MMKNMKANVKEEVQERRGKIQKKTRKLGAVQQKILLLLLGGVALGCAYSPRNYFRIIRGMHAAWKDINKHAAERAIQALYESRMLAIKENADGTVTLILSESGKKRALTYQANTITIKRPKIWDKRWRIFIFDIPESEREARDALRSHFEHMGFYQLQKSAFAFPFECKDEFDFLVELYDVRPYVRFIVAEHIDNEEHLKRFFKLGEFET